MRGGDAAGIPRLYAAASLKREHSARTGVTDGSGIPRLYAAASLKRCRGRADHATMRRYSAALCRGLIEAASVGVTAISEIAKYSAALCRGLIEASRMSSRVLMASRIPRLYAAASLKRLTPPQSVDRQISIPRLYAAASLKRPQWPRSGGSPGPHVFRGFMPRPH